MEKQMNDSKQMKKYVKKTVKPILIFLILSFILLFTSTVLHNKLDNIKNITLFLVCLFAVASLFCVIFLIAEFCSYIRTDVEKIILPLKRVLKYSEIRSVSIRFIHADKSNIAGSVLLGIFFLLSCVVQDDCMSMALDTPKKNRYECVFYMKKGDDIKISLEDYGIEQSRAIVAELESKISRCFYL